MSVSAVVFGRCLICSNLGSTVGGGCGICFGGDGGGVSSSGIGNGGGGGFGNGDAFCRSTRNSSDVRPRDMCGRCTCGIPGGGYSSGAFVGYSGGVFGGDGGGAFGGCNGYASMDIKNDVVFGGCTGGAFVGRTGGDFGRHRWWW